MKCLFQNAQVIDPSTGYNQKADILTEDGLITSICPEIDAPDAQHYDMSGLCAAPGLVDMHCHLRQPGFEHKEDVLSGTACAVMGGFTSVAPMPNTKPACDTAEQVRFLKSLPAYADLFPIASITPGLSGETLCNFLKLKEAGAVAVSDDGKPVTNSSLMRNALLLAGGEGLAVISHCEDAALGEGGGMNDGAYARKLGYHGIPAAAEEIMIARELLLARSTGIPVHIAHVTTKAGVEMIRFAKQRRVRVTAETCPHYFSLTQEAVGIHGTNAKMNPPLRTKEDVLGVIEGLADGTLDAIATDHAPHTPAEKAVPFDDAPSGIIGFETALALGITYLVRPGHLSLAHLLEKMTCVPAAILKIDRGTLHPGAPADIVFFAQQEQFIYHADQSRSKSRNTPYEGAELYGKIHHTVKNGKFVVQNGEFIGT